LVVGKVLTAAVGLTAMAVAGFVLHFRWTIFDTMVTAFGFFLPPTVLPVLAGLVWPRITSRGALAGFLAGLVSGAAFLGVRAYLPASYNYPLQTVSLWVSSTAVVLAMFLASRKNTPEIARIAEFYRSLAQPAVPSPVAILPEPFLISGVVLGLLGLVLGGIGGFAGGPSRLALWVGLSLAALGGALLWRHGRRAREPKDAAESP
jgi:hypothetical protein